ncbi:MAG TPA: BON domain-containing protein [Polyangiaceae bacterium]|nr:BON domain-containing protein [Polyangiaceae bacterium]
MRHLGIFLMGSLALAACASNSPPPATTSSSTVAQATDEPNRGPDFAPASNDGLATAPTETHRAATTTQAAAPSIAPAHESGATATARDTAARDTTAAADAARGNAAATPTDRSSAPATDADNSRVNQRDQNSAALTPMDQGSSESDRKITQQIRQELMKDKSLSFTAKNVKIITIDGKVTLRGPVKSEAERSAIEAAARRVTSGAGSRVDSQLEISK